MKNDIDLNKATNQIEIFDTGVAIFAGKKTLHFYVSTFPDLQHTPELFPQ